MKKVLSSVFMVLCLQGVVSAQVPVQSDVMKQVIVDREAQVKTENVASKSALSSIQDEKVEPIDANHELLKKLMYVFYFICLFTGGGIIFI